MWFVIENFIDIIYGKKYTKNEIENCTNIIMESYDLEILNRENEIKELKKELKNKEKELNEKEKELNEKEKELKL